MAEFKTIVPVLKVADMQRAVDFYTSVLGFTVCWQAASDGGGENCMLAAGATNLLLSTGSHLGDKPQFTGTLYFHMDGVRDFFEKVRHKAPVVCRWRQWNMARWNSAFGTATVTFLRLQKPWTKSSRSIHWRLAMAVAFQKTIPILRIFDVEKAKEFYVGFVGFTVDWEHHFEETPRHTCKCPEMVWFCTCRSIMAIAVPVRRSSCG
jgi:catechol 2,3-dioxygenase-like lactoylglutathione lyase family enzyme